MDPERGLGSNIGHGLFVWPKIELPPGKVLPIQEENSEAIKNTKFETNIKF